MELEQILVMTPCANYSADTRRRNSSYRKQTGNFSFLSKQPTQLIGRVRAWKMLLPY